MKHATPNNTILGFMYKRNGKPRSPLFNLCRNGMQLDA